MAVIRIGKPERGGRDGTAALCWPVRAGGKLYGLFFEVPARHEGLLSPLADPAALALLPLLGEGDVLESEAPVSKGAAAAVRALGASAEAPEGEAPEGERTGICLSRGAAALSLPVRSARGGLPAEADSILSVWPSACEAGRRERERLEERVSEWALGAGLEPFFVSSNAASLLPGGRPAPGTVFACALALAPAFRELAVGKGAKTPGWMELDALSAAGPRLTVCGGGSRVERLRETAEDPELAFLFDPGSGEKRELSLAAAALSGRAGLFGREAAALESRPVRTAALAGRRARGKGPLRDEWRALAAEAASRQGVPEKAASFLLSLLPRL